MRNTNGTFAKGAPGRPKGFNNKVSNQTREAFNLLIENNLDKLQEWLDTIAETDPKAAFDIVLKLAEYVIPKLQRQEHRVEFNEPKQFTVEVINPNKE